MSLVNNMRVKMLVPALLTAVIAAPAMATDQYNDMARVLSATPQTERVNCLLYTSRLLHRLNWHQ